MTIKVLLTHKPGGAYGYISEGWYNAFVSTGHTVARWDGTKQGWETFQPDLYIGCSGHKQPIPQCRGYCRVAIHVNPHGPTSIAGIDESLENIEWVRHQHPNAVFGYGHESDWQLWAHWIRDYSIPWVPMPTAADATIYYNKTAPIKSLDLAYVGGRWPYKSTTIDKYLLPVLQSGKYKYKLYGWGEWPGGVCSGQLPDSLMYPLLSSAKVGPCISEPHTQQWGIDVPERMFKVALAGTLVVHDHVPHLDRYLPSAVVGHDPEEFAALCEYYCHSASDEELLQKTEAQRHEVLRHHTYHARLVQLLNALGLFDAATSMQNYINTII